MRIVKKVIELEEIQKEFREVEEDFDITLISFSFVNDCHYNDYELKIEIFGAVAVPQCLFENSPVVEYFIDLNALLAGQDFYEIEKKRLSSIFDPDFLEFLIQQKVKIVWNSNDEKSAETIDLKNPGEGCLVAMFR